MNKIQQKSKVNKFNFANHFNEELNKKKNTTIIQTGETDNIEVSNTSEKLLIQSNSNIQEEIKLREKIVLTGIYLTESNKKQLQKKAMEINISLSILIETVMMAYINNENIHDLIISKKRKSGRPLENR